MNKTLLTRWQPIHPIEKLLKTDLFDEAVSEGLRAVLDAQAKRVFYIDTSFKIHQMARGRHPDLQTVKADVRQLPFAKASFDCIVSNSTLDHFESLGEITNSLREFYRVLRPGGHLILTLDNLSNPIILLRNSLPLRLLQHLKIVPYDLGPTLRAKQLKILLRKSGFNVLQTDAIMHCPRVLCVAMAHWLEKYASNTMQTYFLRFLMAFEGLSHLPTRFFTGYFIAVKATKP